MFEHILLEDFPEGVKSIYYKGKRLSREEFIKVKEKSNLIKNSKVTS
jgi:hypothetical protein